MREILSDLEDNAGSSEEDYSNEIKEKVAECRVEDKYDGAWAEGAWKENFINGIGELGPAYHEGGMPHTTFEVVR